MGDFRALPPLLTAYIQQLSGTRGTCSLLLVIVVFVRPVLLYLQALRFIFTKFHRLCFCYMDQWHGLTMDDIRRLEEKTKHDLSVVRLDAFCKRVIKYNFCCNVVMSYQLISTASAHMLYSLVRQAPCTKAYYKTWGVCRGGGALPMQG